MIILGIERISECRYKITGGPHERCVRVTGSEYENILTLEAVYRSSVRGVLRCIYGDNWTECYDKSKRWASFNDAYRGITNQFKKAPDE